VVGVTVVVLVGTTGDADVVLPLLPVLVEGEVLRGAAGVEHPAIENATATTTMSTEVPDRTLGPRDLSIPRLLMNVWVRREISSRVG
jgi:hypothetical protein